MWQISTCTSILTRSLFITIAPSYVVFFSSYRNIYGPWKLSKSPPLLLKVCEYSWSHLPLRCSLLWRLALHFKSVVPHGSPVPFCSSHLNETSSSRPVHVCGGLLSRQSPLSTAIWGRDILLGPLNLDNFKGKILNPGWVTMQLMEAAWSRDEQSSPVINRAGSHSTQSLPRLPPPNCWNLLFLYLLKKISFPLDSFQDKTHSFPWLAVPSWKLSSESRCSNSDTYFLTQTFITASHPPQRHYLLGYSQSLKPHRKAILEGSITITYNWSRILFYEAFVSSLLWLLQEIAEKTVLLFFLSSPYSLWHNI